MVPLDNNVCERAIKQVVMGRKSWLFADSVAAGERAMKIMSLRETTKMNALGPHVWLMVVLSDCLPGRKHRLTSCYRYQGSPSRGETPRCPH
ncbi:transposase [Salmonella enterica subsp. enterica serovar Newport]|nr:transposase [Salmonella enterica subsp. enterica serovar Newport]